MKMQSFTQKASPFPIVGGTHFGRYPKISNEQTFNMMISDDCLVDYPGYEAVINLVPGGVGRGLFLSTKYNHMIAVVNEFVFTITSNLGSAQIGRLETLEGDVFIDENDANQIAIADGLNIYIFNYASGSGLQKVLNLDFLPSFISFQDGYFLSCGVVPSTGQANQWRLSEINNGTSWPSDSSHTGLLQTKPDITVAVKAMPDTRQLFVFGKTCGEIWYDTGAQLFPYQRSNYYAFDVGVLSAATIAAGFNIMVWLSGNEKTGPAITVSQGGQPMPIENDGISYKLNQLNFPNKSYGFLYKQNGHVIYQISFYDASDNVSYAYDFTVKEFYILTDEYTNYHIAKHAVFFNNTYFFVSQNDGNLYQYDTDFTDYNGAAIPRIRIPKPFRLPDNSRFVTNLITLTMEQGENSEIQRVENSISVDGGQSFGTVNGYIQNSLGNRQNQVLFWNLGMANDLRTQFQFWCKGRLVITPEATIQVYQ